MNVDRIVACGLMLLLTGCGAVESNWYPIQGGYINLRQVTHIETNYRFHVPPRCAITLGWVEAYLIITGRVEHDMGSFDFSMRAPYGRIAIHFSEMYSQDEYAKDREKAMDEGLEADLLPYDDLCAYKDRIVACVDYLIKHDAGGVMLTFCRPYVFFRPGQKAWLWHRSEVAVWDLPEKTQDYLANVDCGSQRF